MTMADTNDAKGGTTGGTGSNPNPVPQPKPQANPLGSLSDRLMQVVNTSSFQPKNAPAGQTPEPVILEEHVVEKTAPAASVQKIPPVEKPPSQVTADDVGLQLPKPSLSSSVSLTPKPMTMPKAAPQEAPPEHVLPSPIALAPLPGETPAPTPVSPAISPATNSEVPPISPSPPSTPIPASSEPVDTAPQPAPISQKSIAVSEGSALNTDVQKILSQVKLPERREFKAAADPKQPPQEAATSKVVPGLVTKPPTDLEEAKAAASKPDSPQISSVHTLKDDLQHAVKEKKMSLVRAVALEQDKKRDELIEEEFGRKERRRRATGIFFASFLLFGLGFAALFGVYVVMTSHSATSVESLNSIVFAEQSVALPLDNAQPSELKRRVAAARQGQIGSLGSITRIVPLFQGTDPNIQPTQATTKQFFTAMGFNAPDDLVNSLGNTFFFGLHVVDKNAPVIVIPVTNYDRAFAGMLAWEATMNSDLSPAFTPVPSTILDANGIPSARTFQDDVMRNYDVRELKDDSGNVELYYSFPSKSLLIIAESPYSFPELLSRLQSVRRL